MVKSSKPNYFRIYLFNLLFKCTMQHQHPAYQFTLAATGIETKNLIWTFHIHHLSAFDVNHFVFVFLLLTNANCPEFSNYSPLTWITKQQNSIKIECKHNLFRLWKLNIQLKGWCASKNMNLTMKLLIVLLTLLAFTIELGFGFGSRSGLLFFNINATISQYFKKLITP